MKIKVSALLVAALLLPWSVAAQTITYRLGAGWATFGLSLPQGTATAVKIGTLATQVDVKNRWPDGSLRFAVVTAKVPSSGTYPLAPTTAAAGSAASPLPAWPAANVSFSIGGVLYNAALPAASVSDNWLFGPLVRESRVIVVPSANGVAHPLLQVIFDVRTYADGASRLDITTQNVRNIAAMDAVVADVAITINGATVYSRRAITHYSFTRWRKTFPVGGLVEAAITPDFEPAYQAHAFPRYLPTINLGKPHVYDVSGDAFDINGFGLMNRSQGSPGARPELAPFPAWVAEYLVQKLPSQRAITLKHADLSGSWSLFITKSDGVSLIKLTENPDFWFDSRGSGVLAPVVPFPEMGTAGHRGSRTIASPYEQMAARTDAEHFLNIVYPAYMLTGDRFYADQLKLWTNGTVLSMWPATGLQYGGFDASRQGAKGIFAYYGFAGRGWAWPLRELVNAAVATPDADPDKRYFAGILRANLDWSADYNARSDKSGITESPGWESSVGPAILVATWQSTYMAWAIDWAEQQGFDLGPAKEFRNRILRSVVNLLTASDKGYDPRYGFPYQLQVGTRDPNGTPHLFTTWKQLWDGNLTNTGWVAGITGPDQAGKPGFQPKVLGYYGPEERMAVQIAVRENLPGAVAAKAYIDSYREGTQSIADDASYERQGFAFADFTTAPGAVPAAAPAKAH